MGRAKRQQPAKSRPTWAGRIPGGPAKPAWDFMHSLPDDTFLSRADVLGTLGHVRALQEAGVLRPREASALRRELQSLRSGFHPEPGDEDVHSALERILTERLGDLGAKVHAGRSRNDQVATDLRLFARTASLALWTAAGDLIDRLVERAAGTADVLAPGYTHLQRAQPVTVGHWLLSHAWALQRDCVRLEAAYEAADVSVLGAGALAGNTLGIDPDVSARELGFSSAFRNSLDAVSDRDFVCDLVYAATMAAVHLSRLAEDVIVWSSAEFAFIGLPDAYATGSSMMPQKKNPDVAELARAQAGVNIGVLTGLLATLKALPTAYDRDLQADKRHLQRTMDKTAEGLEAMAGLVAGMGFNEQRLADACDDTMLATDLAEALVRRGVPFREAHERVAGVARLAEKAGSLADALRRRPDALEPLGLDEALDMLDPRAAVQRRTTPGGPSRRSVSAQLRELRRQARRRDTRISGLLRTVPR